LWARNGTELFYAANGALTAVTTHTTGALFSTGNPTKIFDITPYYFGSSARNYDVPADGQRFLLIKLYTPGQNAATDSNRLIVVERWAEELKARVGAK